MQVDDIKNYVIKKYVLTLKVPFEICETDVPVHKVAEDVAADKWSEGRYPFDKEMVIDGLRSMLKSGVFYSLLDKFRQEYGRNTQVPTENGYYNKAYDAASKAIKPVFVDILGERWEAEVEARKDNQET